MFIITASLPQHGSVLLHVTSLGNVYLEIIQFSSVGWVCIYSFLHEFSIAAQADHHKISILKQCKFVSEPRGSEVQ